MEDVQMNLGEPSHNAMAAAAAAAAAAATARHRHSLILGQKFGPQPQHQYPCNHTHHMQPPHRLYHHHRHNAQPYQLHRQHLQHQLHQQQQLHHHQLHRQLQQQHRHHPHQVGPQLSHLSQLNQISQLSHLSHLNQISQLNQLSQITQFNQHLQQHQHHMSQLHHYHHQHQHNQHPLLHSQSLPLPSPLPLRTLTLASPALNLNLSLNHKLTGDHQMHHQTQKMQMGLGLDLDLDLDIREGNDRSTSSGSTTGSSNSSRGSSTGSSSGSSSGSTSDQGHGFGAGTELDQDTSLLSTHFPVTYAHAPYSDDQILDVESFSSPTATTQQITIRNGIEIESTTDDEMAAISMSSSITTPMPTQPMSPSPSASFSSCTLPVYCDSEAIATASISLDSASLEGDNLDDLDALYDLKPSASIFMKAANSKLNASAAAYKMRGLDLGFETGGDGCDDGLLPTPTTTFQYKPQHLSDSSAEFRLNAGAAVFKPLRSRGGGLGVPAGIGQGEGVSEGEKDADYARAKGGAVLEGEATATVGDGGDSAGTEVGGEVRGVRRGGGRVVAGVRGGRGLLSLPGLLPAPHPLSLQTHLTHGHPHLHPHVHVHPPHPHPHAHAHAHAHAHLLQRLAVKQNIRYRKQPLPDLFHAVIALMRDLSRSVSYPEIINALSVRLQRPEVELKRHVPHTLHAAVNNGYLRKDGNRYSLLTEIEQVEIMRRNQETAQRAKELEKEPLSWRKR